MRVLVTGSAGFIGYHLCRKLLDIGLEVYGIDNLSRGLKERVNELVNLGLKFYRGDVRDYNFINNIVSKVDVVVHLAALISAEESFKEPILYNDVNVNGTINLLLASIRNKVKSIIYASSAAVYGNPIRLPIDENHPLNPLSPYGVSKLAGEYYVKLLSERHGLRYVILRLFNVYGPGQTGEGAIQIFIKRALKNEDIYIYGDGNQIRAWCYVDDFADGLLRTIEDPKAIGESFNIGNARVVTTIYGLAQAVCRILESKSKIIFKPPLSADIELRIPSVEKANKILGFKAKVGLEEGVLKTAKWIKENLI